jgi:hypothetical protein
MSLCVCQAIKDAPISEVLQACQAWPKDRLECISCLIREREVKVEVMLDLLIAVVWAQLLLFERHKTYQLGH